jgi:hypothetical protein
MRLARPAFALLFLACASVPGAAQDSTAHIFSPGVISGAANDASPAFTPDGHTVYFTRSNPSQSAILVSELRNGKWSAPQIAAFSGEWRDIEPAMSPDGKFMIFSSNRSAAPGGKAIDAFYNGAAQPGIGGNLWRVDRTGTGWSMPRKLPDVVNDNGAVFSPAVVTDGSIYFMKPDGAATKFHLFRAQSRNGSYETPVRVSFSSIDSVGDFDPVVAPDESFMIFSSSGRKPAVKTSLFVSYRRNGSWEEPIYMGDKINGGASNIEARMSPDLQTLYFSSGRVAPVEEPQSREATTRALAAMALWNNGLSNIYEVRLPAVPQP